MLNHPNKLNRTECKIIVPIDLQNVNASGFRVCVKELYAIRYDPVSVNYAVLTGQCVKKQ